MYSQIKRSNSIYILNIQIDTFNIHNQFNKIKLSFFASHFVRLIVAVRLLDTLQSTTVIPKQKPLEKQLMNPVKGAERYQLSLSLLFSSDPPNVTCNRATMEEKRKTLYRNSRDIGKTKQKKAAVVVAKRNFIHNADAPCQLLSEVVSDLITTLPQAQNASFQFMLG